MFIIWDLVRSEYYSFFFPISHYLLVFDAFLSNIVKLSQLTRLLITVSFETLISIIIAGQQQKRTGKPILVLLISLENSVIS